MGVKNGVVVYSVYPRFTSGSPAMVDETTARQVANDERAMYEMDCKLHEEIGSGLFERSLLDKGLGGVVISYMEIGQSFQVVDCLTNARHLFKKKPEFVAFMDGLRN